MKTISNEKNLEILGVEFNACYPEELVEKIYSLDTKEKSAYVSFVGVPGVVSCLDSEFVKKVENSADICAMDGAPIAKISKKRGIKCARCGGPDIMKLVLEAGIERNAKHYFYGCTDEVLAKLKLKLEEMYPNINIVGMYSPPFRELTEEENECIVNEINKCSPDFVWVGLGAPKQDIWMYNNRDKLSNVKMMGVGAAFNFFAGTVKRAPKIYQKLGIEWFYRLIKEPKHLWKRYILGGFKFYKAYIPYSIKYKREKRREKKHARNKKN